jgi:hypothetical protein
MSVEKERRTAGGRRVPIKTVVEIGAGQGGSAAFEAESVDVTTGGMHLRTAYLPEIGEPLLCRFETGGKEVLVQGEVAWRNEEACGGDFGVRFLEVEPEALLVLRELVGEAADESCDDDEGEEQAQAVQRGTRVRLHIEGLASPMKARVRDASTAEVMVGSNLEFLKVGRPLDLENIDAGDKRGARIERVNIEIDPSTRIPQLVVALRYLDAPEEQEEVKESARHSEPPTRMSKTREVDDETDEDLARKAGKPEALWNRLRGVAPVLAQFGGKAKSVVASAIDKARTARSRSDDDEAPQPKRVTSPAPAGGLKTAGRKGVVREEPSIDQEPSSSSFNKLPKKALVIGAASLVLLITIFALARKPTTQPAAQATADSAATVAAAEPAAPGSDPLAQLPPGANGGMVANVPLFGPTPMTTNEPAALPTAAVATPPPAMDQLAEAAAAQQPSDSADDDDDDDGSGDSSAPAARSSARSSSGSSPAPKAFGRGKVKNPVVLSVRMTAPIRAIKGMPTATGFTVHVAGANSRDAVAALARKDARIASIKVTNKGNTGADLTVQFRDGVPAYSVRSAGSNLQIAIGRGTVEKSDDKKTAKAGKTTKNKKAKAKGKKAKK